MDSTTENIEEEVHERWNYIANWFTKLLLWWQGRYNITNAAVSFILLMIHGLLLLSRHPIHAVVPSTLYHAQKSSEVNSCGYETMVVCPSDECNAVYQFCESFQDRNGIKTTKKCSRKSFRNLCQENLLFTKGLSNNRTSLVPYKTFVFKAPSEWLKEMVQSEKFRELLEKRFSPRPTVEMEDIWDGQLWQKLINEANGFLKEKYDIAFMLFVDWVRPYQRSQYSIGTVYLAALNLPRAERFLKKWMCVVGIIPGPTEPKKHMNTYLKPLVDNLLDLWRGIEVVVRDLGQTITVRAILLCLSGDTPAIRKVSQFLSYTANKGCNKCEFMAQRERDEAGNVTGRMSYLANNFNFKSRTKEEVIRQSEQFLSAPNKTTADEIARKNGVRYSELHRLPYFDPVEMCAVDPMHAILLGLVKKEVNLLLSQAPDEEGTPPMLNPRDLQTLKKRLKAIEVPSDCGRLPTALLEKATLDGFTAQQWLLFAAVYARPCFFEMIPEQNYKCLVLLCEIVEACATYRISIAEVSLLEDKIKKHHKLFGSLYGKWKVSINNHLALHLADIMMSYGPCHTFWCFASERLNGILTGLPTSGRSVEKEVFRRFSMQQQLSITDVFQSLPQQLHQDLGDDCPNLLRLAESGRDDEETEKREHERHIERIRAEHFLALRGQEDNDSFERQRAIEREESTYPFNDAAMLPPQRNGKIMSDEMFTATNDHLNDVFEERLVHLSPAFCKFGRCFVNGMLLSSSMSRSERSSYCKGYWAVNESELPQPYFCKIEFFFTINAVIKCRESEKTIRKKLKLAYVKWYKPHSSRVSTERKTGLCRVQKVFYQGYNILSVYRLAQRVVPCSIGNSILMAKLQV